MNERVETLNGLREEVWDCVVQGVTDPDHPAHTLTFATVSPKNWPEARSVVLRAVDMDAATIAVHTDLQSDKIRSLQHTPRAAAHIWDPVRKLQVRLNMHVKIASGEDVRVIWDRVPDHSKQSYGVTPPPGKPIQSALAYVKEPNPDTFAVLHCEVLTIDAVHLGKAHRRAIYSRSDDWMGHWLSP